MDLTRPSPSIPLRNPGPSWGYAFLRRLDRMSPRPLTNALLAAGTWVAVFGMKSQRRHSEAYLATILKRRVTLRDVWRHFHAYVGVLMTRIRAAETGHHTCFPQPGFESFAELMHSGRPALLGTFHFGNSDLLGFLLGTFRRHVHMIRLRLGNSHDTEHLSRTFGEWVTYVWVNQSGNLLFALKHAAESGSSIAMMCDRAEHSSKLEPLEFLGAQRRMPFTIYHLALMFRMPVVFCLSVPDKAGNSLLYSSPVFEPDESQSKAENLARARQHLQDVLRQIEGFLRANPYLWFNFIPLNPPVETAPAATPRVADAAPVSC
ncbi:MAG: hypothetical protein NVV63_10720 [Opitutus sp.]|nr:hypothetical protein [Opitutus sp.]